MVGYGEEDNHFVVELTYNYGQKLYELGNDFQYITVASCNNHHKHKNNILQNGKNENYPFETTSNSDDRVETFVFSPDGHRFKIVPEDEEKGDPVRSITLHVSKLAESLKYWNGLLGLSVIETKRYSNGDQSSTVAFNRPDHQQAALQLLETFSNAGKPINHATGYGRIAFASASSKLKLIEEAVTKAGHKVLTPFVSLDTPGKATVQVVILADPDGYEICFVGDEGFRELSQVDPKAESLLQDAINEDHSAAWFAKHPSFRPV